MYKTAIVITALLAVFSNSRSQEIDKNDQAWLIPEKEVLSGGVPKDGIPSLENPKFTSAPDARYLSDNDLVFGITINGEARAYPHKILDFHEIVNDEINDVPVSIIYCPLTGSGMGWDRNINRKITEFGVSGLLYNSNLVAYDRNTDSYWSQMGLQCVQGELKGEKINLLPVVETTWKTWKEIYPDTKVLSTNTGIYNKYDDYPYIINGKDYRVDDIIIFPIKEEDRRLHRKEKVHGVIVNQKSKAYRIKKFARSIETINDDIDSVPIVVAGSRSKHFAVSFERRLEDGTVLEFTPVKNQLPVVMKDNEGTVWDIFGNGIEGPRAGTTLTPTNSFASYWFAWGAFYPDAEIYKN